VIGTNISTAVDVDFGHVWQRLIPLLLLPFVVPPITLFYGIPTWIKLDRPGPNREAIRVLNFLLGWTIIGWLVAFA